MEIINEKLTNGQIQEFKKEFNSAPDKEKVEVVKKVLEQSGNEESIKSLLNILNSLPKDFVAQWAEAMKIEELARGNDNSFINFFDPKSNNNLNLFKNYDTFQKIYNLYVKGLLNTKSDPESKFIDNNLQANEKSKLMIISPLYKKDIYNREQNDFINIVSDMIKNTRSNDDHFNIGRYVDGWEFLGNTEDERISSYNRDENVQFKTLADLVATSDVEMEDDQDELLKQIGKLASTEEGAKKIKNVLDRATKNK